MLIDSHAHLNTDQFSADLDEVIMRAQSVGVGKIVLVGFNKKTILDAIELANTYAIFHVAIGWHPVDAIDCKKDDLKWIEELSTHKKVVAIGETGLDYHWNKSPKYMQQILFRKQINLAQKVNLPLVIHNRSATKDVVEILRAETATQNVTGVMHCYSGSKETAKECIDMGFYISFGGPVTFKNAKALKEVVSYVPLANMLIETDCPYLSPVPYRGKRNEPAYIKKIALEIAKIKNITFEEVAEVTTKNASKLFNIPLS